MTTGLSLNGSSGHHSNGLLSNDSNGDFDGVGNDLKDSSTPPPLYIPQSKQDLNDLLNKYRKLLKRSNEFKESHDSSSGGKVFDPTEQERTQIEIVLASVSKEQEQFQAEEERFLRELGEEEVTGTVDLDLFSKQVAGLQLLSKDYGLPETLQGELKTGDKKELLQLEANSTPTSTSTTTSTSTLLESLLKPPPADFEARARFYGIEIPPSVHTVDQSYAPLGNYYTERLVTNKISNHLKSLENLPANISTFHHSTSVIDDSLKLSALIELKSLRLLTKQKQLKHNILLHEASQSKFSSKHLVNNPLILQEKRSFNKKFKVKIINPKLLSQNFLHIKKLKEKNLRFSKHIEKVEKILSFAETAQELKSARDTYKNVTLFKQINNYHQYIEKEESKKLERTAKQRLQALKSNDEEAYIKLLDETKDHRITHLLKQTNQFLDTLAQQVKAQQDDDHHSSHRDFPTIDDEARAGEASVAAASAAGEDKEDLREKIDYYQVAHRIKEEIKEQPKMLIGGKLKEYQLKGLQWMVSLYNNKLNGILADEMGLGKTIQSISLISYLIEKKNESKFLVIVPLSTITNWTLEFEKWAPAINVIVYKGSPLSRKSLQYDIKIGNFQVMLTTFEYVIKERLLLSKFNYSHMIIDEGHRMKNATSKLSITLKSYYKTKNRLILTGTPLQNNLPELWALLNFVLPRVFNSVKSFDEWFNTPFANTGTQEKIDLTEEESLLVIRRLHKVLRPFLLRRLKKDVEKDLPNKVERVLKCNLSGLQYVLYQQMLNHNALFIGNDGGAGVKSGIKGLNNSIMQLRKICNHPFVFEEVERLLDSTKMSHDLLWRTSGKFELLDRVLPKFQATGHRVLMFFQMTQVMDIMEDYMRYKNMTYLRLDGSTKADDRQDMLKAFNAPDSEYFCFLLSTRAGGLGLNLQTADTVVIFDSDWNPHQDLQAQDRAHRIGQKNEVKILRLITNDSVEEVILERAHQKLDIDGKVIQAGKFDNKSTAAEQEEFLKRLLENDSRNNEDEENKTVDDDELNTICARGEHEIAIFEEIDRKRHAQDKVSNYPSRLIEQKELPPVFQEDISHHFVKDTKELTKMREKKRVKYDDGLTEEQWLMAMDDDNDTVEDAIRRKEARMAKRTRGRPNPEDDDEIDDDDDEEVEEPEDDGEDEEQDDEEFSGGRKRQRRSRTPQVSTPQDSSRGSTPVNTDPALRKRCLELIDEITKLEDPEDGHKLADIFMKIPSKKLYPDYFHIITHPVALIPVKKQVTQGGFKSWEQFIDELLIMCANAKTYNQEGSFVHSDAEVIEKLLQSQL